MAGVYTQYFQKSKVFLYPLLNLKKGIDFVPEQTYVCWDNLYHINDRKFMCLYNAEMNIEFLNFQERFLTTHPLIEAYFNLGDNKHVYVFNMNRYKHDFDSFVEGKYSKFSIDTKRTIKDFFGGVGNIADYVKSFLKPDEFHEIYAEALGVELELIENVYELCSKPDLEKETINENVPQEIELFKNNSISLDKY
jgi:hypothetical protein